MKRVSGCIFRKDGQWGQVECESPKREFCVKETMFGNRILGIKTGFVFEEAGCQLFRVRRMKMPFWQGWRYILTPHMYHEITAGDGILGGIRSHGGFENARLIVADAEIHVAFQRVERGLQISGQVFSCLILFDTKTTFIINDSDLLYPVVGYIVYIWNSLIDEI